MPRRIVEGPPGNPVWFRPGTIVSNGPFRLAEWRPRDRIRLVKNESYAGGNPARLEAIDLDAEAGAILASPPNRGQSAFDLLRRPDVKFEELTALPAVGAMPASWVDDDRLPEQIRLQVDVQAKYSGYIERQAEEIERQRRNEETALPADLDYAAVKGLSNEVRQRLAELRPVSLGQAARIAGVTPAAISLLLIHLKKRSRAA